MPARHGRKLSYHLLVPIHLEQALNEAAAEADLPIGRYVSQMVEQHLATLSTQSRVSP